MLNKPYKGISVARTCSIIQMQIMHLTQKIYLLVRIFSVQFTIANGFCIDTKVFLSCEISLFSYFYFFSRFLSFFAVFSSDALYLSFQSISDKSFFFRQTFSQDFFTSYYFSLWVFKQDNKQKRRFSNFLNRKMISDGFYKTLDHSFKKSTHHLCVPAV